MADGPRLTTLVVEGIESLMDRYDAAMADGVITAEEDREIREGKYALYALSMDADEGIGMAVTMLRRGPDSVSLKRKMVERGLRLQKDQEASDKIIDIRARRTGTGPGAA